MWRAKLPALWKTGEAVPKARPPYIDTYCRYFLRLLHIHRRLIPSFIRMDPIIRWRSRCRNNSKSLATVGIVRSIEGKYSFTTGSAPHLGWAKVCLIHQSVTLLGVRRAHTGRGQSPDGTDPIFVRRAEKCRMIIQYDQKRAPRRGDANTEFVPNGWGNSHLTPRRPLTSTMNGQSSLLYSKPL